MSLTPSLRAAGFMTIDDDGASLETPKLAVLANLASKGAPDAVGEHPTMFVPDPKEVADYEQPAAINDVLDDSFDADWHVKGAQSLRRLAFRLQQLRLDQCRQAQGCTRRCQVLCDGRTPGGPAAPSALSRQPSAQADSCSVCAVVGESWPAAGILFFLFCSTSCAGLPDNAAAGRHALLGLLYDRPDPAAVPLPAGLHRPHRRCCCLHVCCTVCRSKLDPTFAVPQGSSCTSGRHGCLVSFVSWQPD